MNSRTSLNLSKFLNTSTASKPNQESQGLRGLQDIKIIFFDIDDTLYYKDKAYIPESISQSVIPRLKAKGIIPAIATGRCIGAFPEAIQPLLGESGIELLVTINGQYNCYQQEVITEYAMYLERIEKVIRVLTQQNIDYAFVTNDNIAVSKNSSEIIDSLTPIKKDYIISPEEYLHHSVFQMLAFYPEQYQQAVIDSGALGDDLRTIRWHKEAVDIIVKQHSKAQGIRDVLKYFDLDIKHAMAFGDGLNDLEMLASVGCGVAMGNAEQALKDRADFVTKPIWEEGILYALEELRII